MMIKDLLNTKEDLLDVVVIASGVILIGDDE